MLRLEPTEDGSFTLYNEALNEIYHSRHGALQESLHVFIETGLVHLLAQKEEVNILEVGFGTGFNALLTLDFLRDKPQKVAYCGLETLEIPVELWQALSYPTLLGKPELSYYFQAMHESTWGTCLPLLPNFSFCKELQGVLTYNSPAVFDLVYFDAFAPRKQPEMWKPAVFAHLYAMMRENSSLVTYCAKGQVRRDLQSVGFVVERLEGAAGKFEMLRANKPA